MGEGEKVKKGGCLKWTLAGCGCLILLFVLLWIGSCIGIIGLGRAAVKSVQTVKGTDAYKAAIAAATDCSVVQAELGTPVEDGLLPTLAMISDGGDEGSARFEVILKGPKGEGILLVNGEKHSGEWIYNKMEFLSSNSRRNYDLLAAGAAKRTESKILAPSETDEAPAAPEAPSVTNAGEAAAAPE